MDDFRRSRFADLMPRISMCRGFDVDSHLFGSELPAVPVFLVFLDELTLIRRGEIVRERSIDLDSCSGVDVLAIDPHAFEKFHSCALRFLCHDFFLLVVG